MHHDFIAPKVTELNPASCRGVTLLELLIVVTVLSILLSVGIPSFAGLSQDLKLKSAGFTLFETIHQAKSEAIKRNSETISVKFIVHSETNWCYRITDEPASCTTCSTVCDIENDGIIRGGDSTDHAGVRMQPSYSLISVSNRRGTLPSGNAAFSFGDPSATVGSEHNILHVVTSNLGRVRVCMQQGSISTVEDC